MKKLLALIMIIVLAVPAAAAADLPDISGLSYDELVQLKDQINLAIWESQEWQQVEVPEGTYLIGTDIPAGHWTIIPYYKDTLCNVVYFDRVDKYGKNPASGWDGWSMMIAESNKYSDFDKYAHQCDGIFEEGMYLKVTGRVYFTPYAGKPDLGFK